MQTFLFIDLFNKNGLRNFSAEKKNKKQKIIHIDYVNIFQKGLANQV